MTGPRTVRVAAAALRRGPGAHDVHAAHWPAAEGAAGGPATVCVHGLGGSHLNWSAVGPFLAARGPVWAPDLAGFGYTAPRSVAGGHRRATLGANLDLLVGFVRTVAEDRPVVLAGNSMGGLLALMAAARRPELVAGLVLMNPALPAVTARLDRHVAAQFAAFAIPGLGRRVLDRRVRRMTPEQQVAETMALVCADGAGLAPALLDAHVQLARRRRVMPHAHPAFIEAARSLVERLTIRRQQVHADIAAVGAPTLLLHGRLDRLVSTAAVRRATALRPDWRVVEYDDLGHVPQLEDPQRVARDILGWLDATAAASGETAGRAMESPTATGPVEP